MIRLYFYVEGQTEQTYAHTVLRDHLARFGVFVQGAILAATSRRHGVTHRGGGRHYPPMKNDLERLLKQERRPYVSFTTMFDLYSLYSDFPGMAEADKLKHLPYERVRKLEEALVGDIGDSRLIPYIQLHEFEAILFSDPSAFKIYFENCDKQIEELHKIAGTFNSPELIDDGQHTAPSKRITELFPTYPSAKPDAPVEIATVIDLTTVRSRCLHFNDWLTRLETLGSGQP